MFQLRCLIHLTFPIPRPYYFMSNFEFIKTLDPTEYDVSLIEFDDRHGNFNPENVADYMPENIILTSIRNGQITQAKTQCERYGFRWSSFENEIH